MNIRSMALLFWAVMALGCAHQYVPKEYAIADGRIPAFEIRGVVHAFPAPDPVRDMRVDVGAHYWTFTNETVAQALADQLLVEISKAGGATGPQGDKTLEIGLDSLSVEQGAWVFKGEIVYSVTLGDGSRVNFSTLNRSPGNVWRTLNGTLSVAVIEILKNPEVLGYLGR